MTLMKGTFPYVNDVLYMYMSVCVCVCVCVFEYINMWFILLAQHACVWR